MQSASVLNEISQRAEALAPWAYTVFWFGAVGVAAAVAAASVKAVGGIGGPAAFPVALEAVGLQLLAFAPTIALLSGLWSGCLYLSALSKGATFDGATMTVLREVGDSCVWAGAWAMLITPNAVQWVKGEGGFALKIEAEWLALAGLGVLLGLIGRVLAHSLARARDAEAELQQII